MTNLDFSEIETLEDTAQDLLIKSKTIFELKTIAIGDAGLSNLDDLSKSSQDIDKAIKVIGNVQCVIDIAAKLISLTTCITTGNLSGIAADIKDITTSVEILNQPPQPADSL